MKRIIEVTCSLENANEVIEGLIGDRKTSDLLVTIPVEVEDRKEIYETLCSNPKILQWEIQKQKEEIQATEDNLKENESKPEKSTFEKFPTDDKLREDIGRVILTFRPADLYKFLYILSDIYAQYPSLIPLSKTWENKYYSILSNLTMTFNEDILNKCQVILDLYGESIINRTEEIAREVYNKIREDKKSKEESSDPNPFSIFKNIVNYLLTKR